MREPQCAAPGCTYYTRRRKRTEPRREPLTRHQGQWWCPEHYPYDGTDIYDGGSLLVPFDPAQLKPINPY